MQLGTWEERDCEGGDAAPNLPRGAGLDWRADPPRGLGARRAAGLEVVEEMGAEVWGGDSPQLAENVLGAQRMEVSGLRRGYWG